MTKNILIKKTDKDNPFSLLKKFTQQVRSSGVVKKLKSIRYVSRKPSAFKKKQEALRKLEKTKVRERDLKLGKKPTR